jgi:hypothetical protein
MKCTIVELLELKLFIDVNKAGAEVAGKIV